MKFDYLMIMNTLEIWIRDIKVTRTLIYARYDILAFIDKICGR